MKSDDDDDDDGKEGKEGLKVSAGATLRLAGTVVRRSNFK